MKVRDMMTTHPSVVSRDEPIARAAEVMRARHVGFLPVIDDLCARTLVGVLTDHDIVIRCIAAGHDRTCRVRDHMTTDALETVRSDAAPEDVLALMRARGLRRLPVLTPDGRVTGVISLRDLQTRMPLIDAPALREVVRRVSNPRAEILV